MMPRGYHWLMMEFELAKNGKNCQVGRFLLIQALWFLGLLWHETLILHYSSNSASHIILGDTYISCDQTNLTTRQIRVLCLLKNAFSIVSLLHYIPMSWRSHTSFDREIYGRDTIHVLEVRTHPTRGRSGSHRSPFSLMESPQGKPEYNQGSRTFLFFKKKPKLRGTE